MESERMSQIKNIKTNSKIKNLDKLENKLNSLNENISKIQDNIYKKDFDPRHSNKLSIKSLLKSHSKKRVNSQPAIKDYEVSDKHIIKGKLNSSSYRKPASIRSKNSNVFIEDYIRELETSQRELKKNEEKIADLTCYLNDANRKIFEKDIDIDNLRKSFNDQISKKIPQLNDILNEANSKLFEKDQI